MAKYSYQQLKSKYNGFIDGCAEIDIEGFDVMDKFVVKGLTVQLTAQYEASYAQFTVFEGFVRDGDGYAMDPTLARKLKTGSAVCISLGYGDSISEVFEGYIDSVQVEYSYGYGFSITVTCLDGKGMMMNSYRSEIKTNRKRYSDAVRDTLGRYSDVISGSRIDPTDDLELPFSQLNESDYDFVVRLAKRVNYGFYILKGKAYFVPWGSDRTELITISPEADIISFSMESSLRRRFSKVTVVSNDEKDEKNRITGTASSVTALESGGMSGGSARAVTSDMTKTIVDPSATTGEIARTIAQAELDRQSYASVEGNVEIGGMPELFPGAFMTLSGFGSSFEKSYYIKKVIHRLVGDRFTTAVELGGNIV